MKPPDLDSDGVRALRRAVGPSSWVVFEDVVRDAEPVAGVLLARTNVRKLAEELALSKDTVARALRRLVQAGALQPRADPRGGSGRFTGIAYVVTATCVSTARTPTRPNRTQRQPTQTEQQPQLFDIQGREQ